MRIAPAPAVLVIAAVAACTPSNSPKYANAAIGAGIAVASAGVYRAATGGCWASCPMGTECDEKSGLCVDLPCAGKCPAEHRCVRGECVRAVRDQPAAGVDPPAGDALDAGAPPAPPSPGDPCQGLCFPGERCEMDAGRADCVRDGGRAP